MNKDELNEIQTDLVNFLHNYIDNYNKDKYFNINKSIYIKMLDCVKNIRQTNEKTETCMKAEMNKIEDFHKRIENIYQTQNSFIDNCTDSCEDIKCVKQCSDQFKQNYHQDMSRLFSNYNI